MAPSSFTAGASGPVATRATAATMGAKRSSMACTSSMGEGDAGEADGFGGGAGFRFTLRLSHARIARHGLQALSASDSAPPGGCSASRRTEPYWPSLPRRVPNSKVSISTRYRRSEPAEERRISKGEVVLGLMMPAT